jgi:hypothetical protein
VAIPALVVGTGAIEAWAAVIGSAVAVATFVAIYGRRFLDRQRNRWRSRDQLQGWVDDRNRWHPGALDLLFGWEDDQGIFHPGIPARLNALEESKHDHASKP